MGIKREFLAKTPPPSLPHSLPTSSSRCMGKMGKCVAQTELTVELKCYTELSQIIHEHAPDAVKTGEIKNHFGRKVAIVSSTCDLARKRKTKKPWRGHPANENVYRMRQYTLYK